MRVTPPLVVRVLWGAGLWLDRYACLREGEAGRMRRSGLRGAPWMAAAAQRTR